MASFRVQVLGLVILLVVFTSLLSVIVLFRHHEDTNSVQPTREDQSFTIDDSRLRGGGQREVDTAVALSASKKLVSAQKEIAQLKEQLERTERLAAYEMPSEKGTPDRATLLQLQASERRVQELESKISEVTVEMQRQRREQRGTTDKDSTIEALRKEINELKAAQAQTKSSSSSSSSSTSSSTQGTGTLKAPPVLNGIDRSAHSSHRLLPPPPLASATTTGLLLPPSHVRSPLPPGLLPDSWVLHTPLFPLVSAWTHADVDWHFYTVTSKAGMRSGQGGCCDALAFDRIVAAEASIAQLLINSKALPRIGPYADRNYNPVSAAVLRVQIKHRLTTSGSCFTGLSLLQAAERPLCHPSRRG